MAKPLFIAVSNSSVIVLYRKFIWNFVDITNPLMQLTKENTPWTWSPTCQAVFDTLKEKWTCHPILAHPQFDKKKILRRERQRYWDGGRPVTGTTRAQKRRTIDGHNVRI